MPPIDPIDQSLNRYLDHLDHLDTLDALMDAHGFATPAEAERYIAECKAEFAIAQAEARLLDHD